MRVGDAEPHPDGSTSFRAHSHKTESTGAGNLIAHAMPAYKGAATDLPHTLLRRLLAHLLATGATRRTRLFSTCAKPAASGVMNARLMEGLRLVGAAPPVGRHYSSH